MIYSGPVLLLAGPGTGKAHSLALRVKRLVEEQSIDSKHAEVRRVRERYFLAWTPATKAKYREQDALSYGLAISSDEKLHKGEFVTDDVTQNIKDKAHPEPWVEDKLLDKWLPFGNRWLEWGTARAPSHFRRVTFEELCEVPVKILILRVAGNDLRSSYDDKQLYTNHTSIIAVPWNLLAGVRNNSLKKVARYRGEKPPRPDLPKREDLEETSRCFAVKYLHGVMNSAAASDFLRANRRSNTDLYPDDWKKLPIPDVDTASQAPIVTLVAKILAVKCADPNADVSSLEAEIDKLVYALYGLTHQEIAIIEESLQGKRVNREVADAAAVEEKQ